jgi:hypothetical protein
MTLTFRVLIISGRSDYLRLADACAYDAEDVAILALNADMFTSATDESELAESYDLAIVFAVSFGQAADIKKRLVDPVRARIKGPLLAYIFGAYGVLVAGKRHPLKSILGQRKSELSYFDRTYLGISDDVEKIAYHMNTRTHYLPMAANVLGAAAKPYRGTGDRPIALNAFGRQKRDILDAFCDRLNRPDSDELVYYTNYVKPGEAVDLVRYRAMFWQLLRQSRLSAAFDHFFANKGNARLSYVGPRWFEALAAGTVVIGRAPPTEDRARLLDWQDATIDLSADPATATEELVSLLNDDARLQRASRENLVNMSLRHDWGHRLAEMLEIEGLSQPDSLKAHIADLKANAEAFQEARNLVDA